MRIKELCELIGVTKIRCERCGKQHDAMPLVREMFRQIVLLCKEGNKICIDGFGIFESQIKRGRVHKTPLVKGGEITYPDRRYLSFKQSKIAKKMMR